MPKAENQNFGQEAARLATAAGLETAWHAKLAPECMQAFNHMNRLLHTGANAALEIGHFDNANFLVLLQVLMKHSPIARKLPVVIPISYHQLYYPGLSQLAKFTNISLVPIVTENTKHAEAKRQAARKDIPWPILQQGTGNIAYIRAAREAFKEQAIVAVAPQGKREGQLPFMPTFKGNPMAHIANQAPKNRDFFICPVGIEIPSIQDYSQINGYNVGKDFTIRFGQPITREALQAGIRRGTSVDQQAYLGLEQVVPAAYRSR